MTLAGDGPLVSVDQESGAVRPRAWNANSSRPSRFPAPNRSVVVAMVVQTYRPGVTLEPRRDKLGL